MHPRRLEKSANIALKSRLLPQAVFQMVGEERPDGSKYGADNVIISLSLPAFLLGLSEIVCHYSAMISHLLHTI
jgi:hypothetical protein